MKTNSSKQGTLPDKFRQLEKRIYKLQKLYDELKAEISILTTKRVHQDSLHRKTILTKDYNDTLMNIDQAANMTGLSRTTISKWIKDGIVKYSIINKVKLFRKSDLMDLIDRHKATKKKNGPC